MSSTGTGILGPDTEERGITCHLGSSTVEGVSMHVCLVSTDYSNLIFYVRFEDDKVTNLWVLLGK